MLAKLSAVFALVVNFLTGVKFILTDLLKVLLTIQQGLTTATV